MVSLQKIQSDLFPKLYDAFLNDDDPQSDEQDWRNVFDYSCKRLEDHCGYAMLDDDQLVGMIGMVFSQRMIQGQIRKFCNLHTWWVRDDHRGRSLAMLRPVMKLEDYTITHFTPCDTIRAITNRLGFEGLDSKLKILLPPGGSRNTKDMESSFCYEEGRIANRLDAVNRQILVDHLPYRCGHLLIEDGSDSCYLLYTHVTRHRLPYCHIHYVSNRSLFLERETDVRSSLLQRHRARFVALDHRLYPNDSFSRSFNFWAPAHAVYKANGVPADQIDHLYSDVTFLRLTVLPDMSHELRQLARSWNPFVRS